MFSYVGGFVLLAALLHATWNAMLHGNADRFLSMTWMSICIGVVSLAALPFLPMPHAGAWPCIVASGLVHIAYNMALVRAYRSGDLGETYLIARGSSPMLVALGAALFAREHPGVLQIAGIVLVSSGIISLALQRGNVSRKGAWAAFVTGATIAIYTVIDGIGVRASGDAMAYTAWMFAFYLLMPLLFIAMRGAHALRAPLPVVVQNAAGGLVSIAAYGIVIWAMQYGAMGAVSALRETSVVFAALIGRMFLNEQLSARRLVSCCVIAMGAICIGA
ncbi:Permease of the drug/metabolite transporter (DMT) superfamily [Candidatus Burkholderia verschuerenii]|uniref:Permease of the drug/metabolite transporter (DMT) superfamily n=1 Tax=Candidatus Burkholderia verschuerenii TaxID=242163 RepID=A0A0L0MBV5_9BURK|nr:DMT family transporter [Candidatus Burkholderia verschuerenii]KND59761.1 Permease of the drug/metabolite transporter (DMT) superfamily [Candidatus Burkholderia verschuerenii]